MERENVINKIQKLLKLQYGAEKIGSEGEAYQAAKMVHKLLVDHNLSMSDIDTEENRKEVDMTQSEEITSGSSYGKNWKYSLLYVIADNNLCCAYRRLNGKMFVVGTRENTAIVTQFYDYLVTVFRRLAEERYQEKIKEITGEIPLFITAKVEKELEAVRKKYIRSYLEGVPYGLQQNYENMKPSSEETALVLCHKEQIEDFVNSNFEFDETKHRHRKLRVFGDAFDLGQKDGREVNLNKQIGK